MNRVDFQKDSFQYFKTLESYYSAHLRDILLTDKFVIKNIELLEKAVNKTRKAFEENGSFEFCARCAQSGGKCCKRGLEWKLSPAEFFINLILAEKKGVKIPYNIEREEDCLFLGEKGCVLIMAPLFCRNFFCFKLSEFLGERLIIIQNAMEDEAVLSFRLSDYINKNYLQKISNIFKEG